MKWYDNWIDKQKTKTLGGILESSRLSGVAKLWVFDKVKDWTPLKKF